MKKVRHLVEEFVPSHYRLSLALEPETLTFSGRVAIEGHLVHPKRHLTLHAKDLTVEHAAIIQDGTKHPVTEVKVHPEREEVDLVANTRFAPGSMRLELNFNGRITEHMHGIYPSHYREPGKSAIEKRVISTQFESHHAREAFPCVDEPAAKASFELTLIHPKQQFVISNMPIVEQNTSTHKIETKFEVTPVMSTYLLAFAVGDLKSRSATTTNGTQVSVWATPHNHAFTSFALDTAVKCIEFYNEFFKIPYPLAKADLVAVPDFSAGAMENWGCITFRESALLVDPKNTSRSNRQWVAMVIAHELAHQWFGNLVTMRWWNDLWLNEGFATWVEYLAVDHLYPEWQMWTQFVTDDFLRAQQLDALQHTHPIEVPIRDPDEIRSIFDSISYSKGASVLRMLYEFLGSEDFRAGLTLYLKRHSYGNATTDDLWEALGEISGKDVAGFMSGWTKHGGFPFLSVRDSGDTYAVQQKRFTFKESRAKDLHFVWPVPISAASLKRPVLLESSSGSVPKPTNKTVKLNSEQTGFYIVKYEPKQLAAFGDQVEKGKLSDIDRLGLLNDAFQLAKSGQLSTVDALKLLDHYRDEDNAAVWDIITAHLSALRRVMSDESTISLLKPFVARLIGKEYGRLGWTPKKKESYFDSLLRPTILGLGSFAQHPEITERAIRAFHAMERPDDIEPDLRPVVFATAARHGDKPEYDKLLKLYMSTLSAQERINLAGALTDFRDPTLINSSLDLITSKHVKLQDVAIWVNFSFANRFAKDLTWQWLKDNWNWFVDKLGNDIMTLAAFPKYAASVFSHPDEVKDFKRFFASHNEPGIERPVRQAIETVEWQVKWRSRDEQAVWHYLQQQLDASPTQSR